MPVSARLTALFVSKASNPGMFADGGGLYLHVGTSGSKSWIYRFTLAGKAREMGLGPVVDFPLAEARERARECRRLCRDGIDPIESRRAARVANVLEASSAISFSKAAQLCVESKKGGWRNLKHSRQWISTLATYANPTLGALPVAAITVHHVLEVIEPIWLTKTETADRVRQRIEAVLAWAAARGYRSPENPARWRGCLDTTAS